MIWQENVENIILMENIIEDKLNNGEQYWPSLTERICFHGKFKVDLLDSQIFADFEQRYLNIAYDGRSKRVVQHHFTSWPDHSVPVYPQSLITFVKVLLKLSYKAPTVIHCSSSGGKTGTIILTDICLRMAAKEKYIDVFKHLQTIHNQRPNMVENADQYKLVHLILLQCLHSPLSSIHCSDLDLIDDIVTEEKLQIQFKYLRTVAWQDRVISNNRKTISQPRNMDKNRFPPILADQGRVVLPRYPENDVHSDYINAVYVDGFRVKNLFIVSQIPLPNTVQDFWRMIYHQKCPLIVSLNGIPKNDATCCSFWPAEKDMNLPCGITIQLGKIENHDIYDVLNLHVTQTQEGKGQLVQLIHFKAWAINNMPKNVEEFVSFYMKFEEISRGKSPVTVTCYDGVTSSGVFVAFAFIVEKMNLEQECDPYLGVRIIRRNRMQFVEKKIQMKFLYAAAAAYIQHFETYANFQPPSK